MKSSNDNTARARGRKSHSVAVAATGGRGGHRASVPAQRFARGTDLGTPDHQQYEIVARLGAGAGGVVYDAICPLTERHVALKALHRPDSTCLRREFARVREASRHSNLVELYDKGRCGELWFYTMELVHGLDMQRYMRPSQYRGLEIAEEQTARMDEEELLASGTDPREWFIGDILANAQAAEMPHVERLRATLAQVVDGVHALHEAGFVHRDVKPSNVLVDEAGQVRVVDFGVLEMIGRPLESQARYSGTPAYMAPEQFRGALPAPSGDWYAVGMTLFRALTGYRPFHAPMDVVAKAKQEVSLPAPCELVDGVPDDLNELCVELLSADPKRRPTYKEIRRVLAPDDK